MDWRRTIDRLSEFAFNWGGCSIFLPYLSLYLLFWITQGPVALLKVLFWILHLIFFALWIRRRPVRDGWVWGLLFLVFLIPGAYLEFPTDAWEHFDRIVSWDFSTIIRENATRQRFAYFWSWTFLEPFSPAGRRLGLGVLSAFWQWLVCWNVFALMSRLGFSRQTALLQTWAFALFFGTNILGLRYYALSSTPLAYALYLQAVIALLDLLDRQPRSALRLALLLVGILANHLQEIVLFLVSATGIAVFETHRRCGRRGFLMLLAFAFAITAGVMVFPDTFWAWLRFSNPESKVVLARTLDVLSFHSRHWQTIAVPGLLGLVFAGFMYRRHPLFTLLTFGPLFLCLWPPSSLFFAAMIRTESDTYRILYAFPPCFSLALLVQWGFEKLGWRARGTAAIPFAAILVLSLPVEKHWWGRGFLQFYRPPSTLELDWIPQTFSALESVGRQMDHREYWSYKVTDKHRCPIATDPATGYALRAHPYFKPFLGLAGDARRSPISVFAAVRSPLEFIQLVEEGRACGVLLVDPVGPTRVAPSISAVGLRSGHWNPAFVNTALNLPTEVYGLSEVLASWGWKKQRIAPFYTLWTMP